jgi:DNA-binding MarR family transcriptional regulator
MARSNKKRTRTALFEAPAWADMLAIRAIRLGDTFVVRLTAFLAQFGVTPLQFHVLRIVYVRDEDGEGLPVGVIGGALLASAPDVTRLIDRLEKLGYLERIRKPDDRRVVRVRLTDEGLALVERIHGPLIAHHDALLAKIPKSDLKKIAEDLRRVLDNLPS